jgi:DOPA 4,5-dioxygenase
MISDKFNNESSPPRAANYHVHIYYELGAESEATAKGLAQRLRALFPDGVTDLREYDKPGGPHAVSNVAVHLTRDGLADILPWLQANHGGHAMLLHPKTGDVIKDHIDFGTWIGPPRAGLLNEAYFERKRRERAASPKIAPDDP